jgi:hypothetical protein
MRLFWQSFFHPIGPAVRSTGLSDSLRQRPVTAGEALNNISAPKSFHLASSSVFGLVRLQDKHGLFTQYHSTCGCLIVLAEVY